MDSPTIYMGTTPSIASLYCHPTRTYCALTVTATPSPFGAGALFCVLGVNRPPSAEQHPHDLARVAWVLDARQPAAARLDVEIGSA